MKTSLMQLLEIRHQQPLEEMIRTRVEAGKTLDEIAQDLGITRVTLHVWLNKLGARFVTKKTVSFSSDGAAASAP
jgi:DNA invertase Pin-like site-specific DNA recombinase